MRSFVNSILFLLAAPALSTAQSRLAQQAAASRLAMEGGSLSARSAADLERRIAAHPNDVPGRTKLLGYYQPRALSGSEARSALCKHVVWLIRNHPDAGILGTPFAEANRTLDGKAYQTIRDAWMKQVEAHPRSARILGNAAAYLLLEDGATAAKLLKRAEDADPKNPDWPQKLGYLYSLEQSDRSGKIDVKIARMSYAAYERALSLASGLDRSYMLGDVAHAAYDSQNFGKARKYALELLKTADHGFPTGVDGNAIHHGNLILGRLALRDGKVGDAKKYLLAAGKTPGSPQLDSFGPNMSLAKELLEKGEKAVVLEYFALCAKFWHGNELDGWTDDVKAGRIPDFGANLVY